MSESLRKRLATCMEFWRLAKNEAEMCRSTTFRKSADDRANLWFEEVVSLFNRRDAA